MKTIYRHIILLALLIAGGINAFAAEEDLFDDPMVRDEISLRGRPIYFDNEDRIDLDGEILSGGYLPKDGRLEYHYLSNRRALTGESCNINKLPSSVTAGGWTGSLNALLNDDLEDYCEFNSVVNVGVTVNPVFSIRDRSCFYAKGTEAGFCLVASGVDVLSLDVVKAMAIGFYREGKLVKVVPAKEGQDGSGVNLSLIQVPGSKDAVVYVTAEAPGVFDEISLDYSGGVNISAGQNIRVKYGFVGKSRMFTITKNKKNGAVSDYYKNTDVIPAEQRMTPFQKYSATREEGKDANRNADLDYAEAENVVLLGIPYKVPQKEMEKFIDADLDNYVSLTPILTIGYQGGAKFMMKDTEDSDREIFEAGTEVGFCYDFGSALSVDAGSFLLIRLFDRNGNQVEEQTVSAGVLSLSVAKGGGNSSSIVSSVPFSGAQIRFMTVIGIDLGGIFVKYAYVRDKADIRHHCPIDPSMDTPICSGAPTYQLRSNPDVSVTWTLVEQPEGADCSVTPGGYVTGLTAIEERDSEGNIIALHKTYRFRATAADGCYDEVALTYDGFAEVECSIPMTNEDGGEKVYELAAHVPGETSGSLLTIDKIKDAENILEENDKYAVYQGGLKLLNDLAVIGIKIKPEYGYMYDAENEQLLSKGKRLGFIVADAVQGLDLSLLQFYQIGAYCDGKLVYRGPIDESNSIDASIGGVNKVQKMRFSVVVPTTYEDKETGRSHPTKVDQIVLWRSGVLDLAIGDLHIYNAFWEDPDSKCGDVMGCGAKVLSPDTHTTLDFDRFVMGGAVDVATAINDLDNIVDDDMTSHATIFKSVGISGITIAVNLGRTMDYRHQLGVVLDNKSYVADVNVAKVIQAETLYKGKSTGDKFTDWNVVDANVLGYGDKRVLLIQPKLMYDEVLLTFGAGVDLLNDINIYGLFVRGDVDNDGIPDCQDSQPCSDLISGVEVNPICIGDNMMVTVTGQSGRYTLTFTTREHEPEGEEPGGVELMAESNTPKVHELEIPEGKDSAVYNFTPDIAGQYQIIVYDAIGTPAFSTMATVHPTFTRWLDNASSADWNKWDNWTEGSPYCCTNVVIPSDARVYPDLDGEVERGDEFCCNYIHFEPRAEIGRVLNLNYNRAWVEMELTANRYHLLSAPLQSTFTGDMYIPREMKGIHQADYFSPINDDTADPYRFDPTIYQRLWNKTAKGQLWSGNKEIDLVPVAESLNETLSTRWSREFNHLAALYGCGQGFSVWVDNGMLPDEQIFRFRFPKEQTKYNYFNDFDREPISDLYEDKLARTGLGRFIYEPEIASPLKVTVLPVDKKDYLEKYGYDSRRVYGVGAVKQGDEDSGAEAIESMTLTLTAENPTECFLFGNPFMSRLDIRSFMEANGRIKEVMAYDGNSATCLAIADDEGIWLLSDITAIAPMQAVYVRVDAGESETLDIKLTPEMTSEGIGNQDTRKMPRGLRIRLESGAMRSGMFVSRSLRGRALLDNEVAPALSLFAIQDGEAFDVVADSDRIPLTVIKKQGEHAVIDFDVFGGAKRDDYRILDLVECREYSLDYPIELPVEIGTTSGRFVLLSLNNDSGIESMSEDESDIIVSAADGMINVRSLDDRIVEVGVYLIDGSQIKNVRTPGAAEVEFETERGVRLVKVKTSDGKSRSFKLLV